MGHEKDQEKEMGIVMDTPERTQIANPLSKFEVTWVFVGFYGGLGVKCEDLVLYFRDSPVFNYINSLSPIKPVKSVHFTQTFSTLNFATIPSVFTSPHVSSLKDSKFLKRHQFSDSSKPELTSDDAKKAETSEANLNATQNLLKQQTDINSSNSITDTSAAPSNGCSNLQSRKLIYEPVRLGTNTLKTAGPSALSVPFISNGPENGSFRNEPEVEGINELPHSKEVSTCDWDSLISDGSELLNFNSPTDTVPYKAPDQNTLHPTSFNTLLTNAKPQANPLENDEGLKGAAENYVVVTSTSLNKFEVGVPVEDTDNEVRIYRRRKCFFRCANDLI
ncbi:putative CRC domain-containing protein TSO1 [Helianthus annuus]|nr:putative CRC domain-containing protein TSO1 [Helianthus annuus]